MLSTFRSLSHYNFRLFFAGQSISVVGTWMQKVAQVWLILELTSSGVILGVTAALQHLPTLVIGPWAGLLADRVTKRKILLWTQSAAAVPAAVLGALVATDVVQVWMVLLLALLLGVIEAIDKPARHTFVIEMVGTDQVINAVTLNSIVINTGKVAGPAIGGLLIGTIGLAYSFLLNAVSYLAVIAGLALMRTRELQPATRAVRARGQIRAGFSYVRRKPDLLAPLVLMTATGLLAYEWMVTLPLLARGTFDGDAEVFGLMFSAMGLGAIVGGLALAGLLRPTTDGLAITGVVFAVLLMCTAVAPTLEVAYVLLFCLGASSTAFRAVATSLVQVRADPEMRGRTMALLVMAVGGTTPLGGPLIGWVAETLGARVALALGGVATLVAASVTWLYLRRRTTSTS
ncbi:MFS transporter [Jiangella ureilytica]|nr:MFS transporter [Jiangella ureilytica]